MKEKPRIKKLGKGGWVCRIDSKVPDGKRIHGYGATPKSAYERWEINKFLISVIVNDKV